MHDKKELWKKRFSTSIYPNTKIEISGPCNFIFKEINNFGQANLTFELNREHIIEVFKLKKETKGEKS